MFHVNHYQIAKPIQQLILDYRKEKRIPFRDFLEPELRHTALNNVIKGPDKYIQLDTLEKILNKHPELAKRIAGHFCSFLKENTTQVAISEQPALVPESQDRLELLRDLTALRRLVVQQSETILNLTRGGGGGAD